jgi:hypothetical protein
VVVVFEEVGAVVVATPVGLNVVVPVGVVVVDEVLLFVAAVFPLTLNFKVVC